MVSIERNKLLSIAFPDFFGGAVLHEGSSITLRTRARFALSIIMYTVSMFVSPAGTCMRASAH